MKKILVCAHNLRNGGGIPVAQNLILEVCQQLPEVEFLATVPAGCGYEAALSSLGNCTLIKVEYSNIFWRQIFDRFRLASIEKSFGPNAIIGLGNMTFGLKTKPAILMLHNPFYVYPRDNWGSSIPLKFLFVRLQRYVFARDLKDQSRHCSDRNHGKAVARGICICW